MSLLLLFPRHGLVYSRQYSATLPATGANLNTVYTVAEVSNVASTDSVYVDQTTAATGDYAIHEFEAQGSSATAGITGTWVGKSTKSAASQSVKLSIYNRSSGLWEILASNATATPGSNFTLTGTQSTSMSNYYDANNMAIFRVYQKES